jgi:uncharacterized membrane protein SpoIIM required for sporulation
VSFAHLVTLDQLQLEPGIAGARLARRLLVTAQTMTGLLRRLELDGAIERRPDPQNRRADRWYLLPAGVERLNAARSAGAPVMTQMLSMLRPQEVAELERMYDPTSDRHKLGRESGTDWYMFGVYIMNNISIGLRTFASGLLAGIGTILVLILNGIGIGAAFGHLQQIGSGDPLWRFVAGHAPFELTAIVLAGGAGLRLGFNLIAPGRRTRIDALVAGGLKGARLCLGIAFMLLVAAFIEAFWSSTQSIPASVKYTVSGVLWTLVLLWLWRGGRNQPGDADAS